MSTARPREALSKMTEGDIAVFTLGPTMIDKKDQKYYPLQKLYCRNGGYHLRIQPNGTVDASRQDNDVYGQYAIQIINVVWKYKRKLYYVNFYQNTLQLVAIAVSFFCVHLVKHVFIYFMLNGSCFKGKSSQGRSGGHQGA